MQNKERKETEFEPRSENSNSLVSLCPLIDLPLVDLVRAITSFYLLIFSKNVYVPSPKKKVISPWDASAKPEASIE